jgi:integrase
LGVHGIEGAVQRDIAALMSEDVHLLMEVFFAFGGRPSEAVALKGCDLLPDGRLFVQRSLNRYRVVGPTKNKKSRKVDIPSDLHARLVALGRVHDAFLFVRDGRPLTTDVLSHEFKKAAKDAGYPQLKLYATGKHSMASITAREAEQEGIERAAARMGVTREIAERHYIQKGEVVEMKRVNQE